MIEEMQTHYQKKTYLRSPVASYQAQTHGWQNSTGNCSPAPTLHTQKQSNWAVQADQSRGYGDGGGGHTCKIQLPAPLTWDEPHPAIQLPSSCHSAAIQPECILYRALPTADRNCHLPLVHVAQDRQPKPLGHRGTLPRSSRMNRIRPPPLTLSNGVGGPGAHVHPATTAKATLALEINPH